MDEGAIGNMEYITKQPDKVIDKIEEPVDAEEITEEARENPDNIDA